MHRSKPALSIASLISILASGAAVAGELKVDITSFVAAGSRTRAAELCGKVTGIDQSTPSFVAVRVVVDHKSNKPGVYNVLVGRDGAFCTTVVSYYGTAVASVWNSSVESLSAEAQLARSPERN